MGKGLIHRAVVVAPREVGGGTGLLTGTCRTGNAVDVDVAADDARTQCRQQGQLDAGGKAAGICQVLGLANLVAMGLR